MAYRASASPGAREPVVLLHALGDESSYWDEVAAELSGSWRVYAVDLRGYGRTDWPGTYSLQLMRDDLVRLLDALNLQRVALVGHYVHTAEPARFTQVLSGFLAAGS
jgi:3-oxoadipate enol-lactonase